MRATVLYAAGDVRVENVPDATIVDSTDAVLRIARASICGSDLWPYNLMEPVETGRRMGHEAIGVVEAVGADVHTLKHGEVVVMPFAFPTGRAPSAAKDCTPRAPKAGSSARSKSPGPRPKPCRSPWPTGRSSSSRSARMTP